MWVLIISAEVRIIGSISSVVGQGSSGAWGVGVGFWVDGLVGLGVVLCVCVG